MTMQDDWWRSAPVVGPARAAAPQSGRQEEWWSAAPVVSPAPQQAPNPARAAPSRPRPASSPMAGPQAAPAARLNDLGITDAQERDALIYQGYTPEQADAEMAQRRGDMGGYDGPAQPAAALPSPPSSGFDLPDGVVDYNNLSDAERNSLRRGARVLMPQNEGESFRQIVTMAADMGGPSRAPMMGEERQSFGGVNTYVPGMADQVGAFASGAAEQVPLLDEAAILPAMVARGQSFSEARDDYRNMQTALNSSERDLRNAGGIAGFATSFAVPGGALIGRGGNLANRALRAGGVGAGVGALYGAGAADGGLGERAIGAGQGTVLGGLTGGALPLAGAAVGATGRFVRRTTGRLIDEVLERPQNAAVAQREAMETLRGALQSDGVSESVADRLTREWLQSGVTPNLVDLAPRGGQTQRLLRGAAMRSGPAATAAESYLDRMAGGIQDNAMNLTRQLTPDQRTAAEVVDALGAGRSNQAQADYAGPYLQQVPVDEGLMSAFADEPGRAALRRGRAAAVARRDYDQVAEIDSLLNGEAPQSVSAATLDRGRIAMAGRGRNLMTGSSARPDIAGGLFSRADDIDAALDAVPAIQPARETYRRFSDGIEGVEIGQSVRSADPDVLMAQLAGRDGARYTAPVGAARSLETAIGAPAEGATGVLNRIATSPNMTRNLGSIFGQGDASRYQSGIGNLTDQLNNARFMASSTGSQSIGRAADMVDPIQLPQGPISALLMAIEKVRRGVQLTEAESEILMGLAQQPVTLGNRGLFGGRQNRSLSGYAVPAIAGQLGTVSAPQ